MALAEGDHKNVSTAMAVAYDYLDKEERGIPISLKMSPIRKEIEVAIEDKVVKQKAIMSENQLGQKHECTSGGLPSAPRSAPVRGQRRSEACRAPLPV